MLARQQTECYEITGGPSLNKMVREEEEETRSGTTISFASSYKYVRKGSLAVAQTVLLVLILLLLVAILGMTAYTLTKDDSSSTVTGGNTGAPTNDSVLLKQLMNRTKVSAQKLTNIVSTLSNLKDTSTSTAGVIDDILLVVEELLVVYSST